MRFLDIEHNWFCLRCIWSSFCFWTKPEQNPPNGLLRAGGRPTFFLGAIAALIGKLLDTGFPHKRLVSTNMCNRAWARAPPAKFRVYVKIVVSALCTIVDRVFWLFWPRQFSNKDFSFEPRLRLPDLTELRLLFRSLANYWFYILISLLFKLVDEYFVSSSLNSFLRFYLTFL